MTRKIVIGDIHGCYDELLDLLNQIGPGEDDLLIPVGDIIDRGPKSVQVFNLFQSRKNTVVLMGNHERKHVRGTYSSAQKITQYQFGRDYTEARNQMRTFPYFFEDDDVIIVHAAMQPGVLMEDQPAEILCGTMGGEKKLKSLLKGKKWFEMYNGAKPVIFGHRVIGKTPFIYDDKTYGIDTGACHGGWLTAISLPDFRIYSVKARKNYWSQAKQQRMTYTE